jgi:hypothetical protein
LKFDDPSFVARTDFPSSSLLCPSCFSLSSMGNEIGSAADAEGPSELY